VSSTRRHAFSLVFSNGMGTTMSQRFQHARRDLRPGTEESFKGLTIGFIFSTPIV